MKKDWSKSSAGAFAGFRPGEAFRTVAKTARATLVAGACLAALVAAPAILPASAHADGEVQIAALNPGHLLPGKVNFGNVGLSASDIDRYKQIFDAQDDADWDTADKLIAQVTDKRLMGYVLYQRYMAPDGWVSSYEELAAWLKRYNDLPGADRIYALALKRKPAGVAGPKRPVTPSVISEGNIEAFGFAPPAVISNTTLDAAANRRSQEYLVQARDMVSRRAYAKASSFLLAHRDEIDDADANQLLGRLAEIFFRRGQDAAALAAAKGLLAGEGEVAPSGLWYGGLAAWKLGKYQQAYPLFDGLSKSNWASAWDRSAGAYWAARTALRMHKGDEVTQHLQDAAAWPHTFYGLIAARWLGTDLDFNWHAPALTHAHITALAKRPGAFRAIALLQVGQRELAEEELKRIDPAGDYLVTEGLVALADYGRLPRLSLMLGNTFTRQDGGYFDDALYPVPSWTPPGGYQVDPALVLAFMKRESRFEPDARSGAGAIGLMQIMPMTARYVAGSAGLSTNVISDLRDPLNSTIIGDAYISELLTLPGIEGNLIKMAIAYNGGPGNLKRWDAQIKSKDPLLYIEMIPVEETRVHVLHVLANYWLYQQRFGQPSTSLDQIVQGDWPTYLPPGAPTARFVVEEPQT